MAPRWLAPAYILTPRDQFNANATFSAVKSQWQNPADILSVLMIIGGDIVQNALAQLVGGKPFFFTPVAFSFGWVAYSFSAILSVVGSGSLMPPPDCEATCINVESGYARDIKSWVLSRLVRDYELAEKYERGLTIRLFRTSCEKPIGMREHDWVYNLGFFTIILQLGIACIPGALTGNWMILIITFGGNFLAQLSAALPQWRHEMWKGRKIKKGKREVVCLTCGNGSKSVLVVDSEGCGIKLEDLAGARVERSDVTIVATFMFASLWIVHLLTVESLADSAWYSLAIGAAGMLQNVISAGARRTPAALGFHLDLDEESSPIPIHDDKVFKALQLAEDAKPGVGLALIDVFFPGPTGLRPDEEEWRKKVKSEAAQNPAQNPAEKETAEQMVEEKAEEKHKETVEQIPTPRGPNPMSPSASVWNVSGSSSTSLLPEEAL